jgi:hypothetical protein
VEVLTVDLHLANQVRCANATIAEKIAKLLKIPVKRISVTPWSWSLPNPGNNDQAKYLAFVQEDHERCDCQNENGKVDVGSGFRKVQAAGAIKGLTVAHDTTIMTVSQYKALYEKDASKPPPSAAVSKNTVRHPRGVEGIAAGFAVPEPPKPASRVQMLSRDPCLVHLLREMTGEFKLKISFLLGVPENKVIIDPPAVQGTVGLLQLDSTVSTENEAQQVPVLAVQHCSLIDLAATRQNLALLDMSSAPAPAPAIPLAAAPGLPMVYTVAIPNGTSNATNVTEQRVNIVMKLDHLDYELLSASWALVSSFTSVAKAAIAEAAHVPVDGVKMSIWPGSTVIEASITPPNGTAAAAVLAFLNGTLCNATVDRLNTMTALQKVMTSDFLDCYVMSIEVQDPPFAPEESNRAWIATWSITLLPPFAQDGAWRLLNMVNDPASQLSKLLPMTLARIPGMKYRGLQTPNLALQDANETRLPPPEDKAVGFAIPDPYDEQARIEAEKKRMKRENAAAALNIRAKSDMEQMKAQDALQQAQRGTLLIKNAAAQFTNAAYAHASAIRAPNASRGPDIVPFEALENEHLASESPYPWRDQEPPARFMLSMAQEPAPQQNLRQQGSKRLSLKRPRYN